MPQKAERFIFRSYSLDRATSTARFAYACECANGDVLDFTETLTFPVAEQAWAIPNPPALEACLQGLHMVLGLSYWKLHCAPQMVLESFSLTPAQAEFWQTVYTKGMGEFFYRNSIDFRGLVKFPSASTQYEVRGTQANGSRCLIPLGGGKDSLVTVELVKSLGLDFDLFTLGTSHIQKQTADAVGKNPLVVTRILDPRMLELSKTGDVYNGHIPITAVYVFTGILTALLGGYRYVVFSNERSADEGNLEYLGQPINHQWSKTLEAEKLFADYIRDFITPDAAAFSLLRPLSELAVIERFSNHQKYFPVFSSCNRNFVIGSTQPQAERGAYWCGGCPKCAFVFTLLSAYLSKAVLVGIFGKDLYADAYLLQLYRDLLGRGTCKPFECVGSPDEMLVAMQKSSKHGEYAGEPIMEYFEQEVAPLVKDWENLEKELMTPIGVEGLPESFRRIFP